MENRSCSRRAKKARRIIYLDNAATTLPKPTGVANAVKRAVECFAANPGRGAHALSQSSARELYEARKTAACFFGADEPEKVIFTPGCTYSINFVLKGILRTGDHVVISDLEHNAVVRPLHTLEKYGVTVTRAHVCENDPEQTVRNFCRAVRRNTRLVFCTHASNVSGIRLPIEDIGDMCARLGIPFGVDAAQSAGVLPLSLAGQKVDYICVPAHKGLYGAAGTGALIMREEKIIGTVIEGGTGSASSLRTQPEEYPDRLESGTLNIPGITAMRAGIEFVNRCGAENIARHEYALMCRAYDGLRSINGVKLYTMRPERESHVPLLPFNIGDLASEECSQMLSDEGIAVRAGYHCAYDAHLSLGTAGRGAVRICPSVFTSGEDIDSFIAAVKKITQKS